MGLSRLAKILLPVLLLSLFVVPIAFARVVSQNTPVYSLKQDEAVDDDLFVVADNITVAGTVHGDVYAFGDRITITGTVDGDVYAAGRELDISGSIGQDVVVGGAAVTIRSATIGDSLVASGATVTVADDVTIAGAFIFGAGDVTKNAEVGRGMYGIAGTLDLNGSVGKDAWLSLGSLIVREEATIAGDLTYSLDREAELPETLTVGGTTNLVASDSFTQTWNWRGSEPSSRMNLGYQLWSYSAALLIGLLFLYFFGGVVKNVTLTMHSQLWSSLGWGIAVLFGTMPVIFIVMLTIVGIPLGFLLMGLFFLEIYFAKIFLGALYGTFISDKVLKSNHQNRFVLFALGLGVYYVIGMVPFLNVAQSILAIVLSLGAVFIVKRQRFLGPSPMGPSSADAIED